MIGMPRLVTCCVFSASPVGGWILVATPHRRRKPLVVLPCIAPPKLKLDRAGVCEVQACDSWGRYLVGDE